MLYEFEEMSVTGVCAYANIFKRQTMPNRDTGMVDKRDYAFTLVVDVDSHVDSLLNQGIQAKLNKKHRFMHNRTIDASGAANYRLTNRSPFPVFTQGGENIRVRSEGIPALDSFFNGCTVKATIQPFAITNSLIYRRVILLVKRLEILDTPHIPEQWSII